MKRGSGSTRQEVELKGKSSPRKSLGFWVGQLGDRKGIATMGEARNQGKVRSSGKTILS